MSHYFLRARLCHVGDQVLPVLLLLESGVDHLGAGDELPGGQGASPGSALPIYSSASTNSTLYT